MDALTTIAQKHYETTGENVFVKVTDIPYFLKTCEEMNDMFQYDVYLKIEFLSYLFKCDELYRCIKYNFVPSSQENLKKFKIIFILNVQGLRKKCLHGNAC